MEISDLKMYQAIGKRGHPSLENREWVEHEKETKRKKKKKKRRTTYGNRERETTWRIF
jgi:hypothetical protein